MKTFFFEVHGKVNANDENEAFSNIDDLLHNNAEYQLKITGEDE